MERIVYQKTLDVHKNGVQFTLQGFETADNLTRRIEISLMASGDAIDFPLEKIMAVMYVNVPGADGPSIVECEIKNNTIVYDVLPIATEGITEMQLKLMEISPNGAKAVLAMPKFAVEVTKSNTDEEGAVQTSTFTALEDALAKAKAVYDSRFLSMELSSDCMFRVRYADGTVFESDMLREMFHKGESVLSQSYARGDTGVRKGEATDNSMYYSKVAESASIDAEMSKEDAQEILDEVRLHGVYTAFGVNFETGEVEYISPRYSFKINTETGHMDAEGQTFGFFEEIGELVNDWLIRRDIDVSKLLKISGEHTVDIRELKEESKKHTNDIKTLDERVTPIDKGGTGVASMDALVELLGENKMCRIETGTYTGTGTVGQANPNKITYSKPPKLVFVNTMTSTPYGGFCWVYGSVMVNTGGSFSNTSTWTETELQWYSQGGNATDQLNNSGNVYSYTLVY